MSENVISAFLADLDVAYDIACFEPASGQRFNTASPIKSTPCREFSEALTQPIIYPQSVKHHYEID